MSRFLKQFLYGVLYLAIIVGVGYGFYAHYLRLVPSCFDNVQNQGEVGVDCGGPCMALCTAAVQPITALGQPTLIPDTADNASIFAEIENANGDFGATSFAYVFTLYDASGTPVQSVPGMSFIYPGETRYLMAIHMPVASSAVSVGFWAPTSTTDWIASGTMGSTPEFTFQNIKLASAASGRIAASGLLVNAEGAAFTNVQVVALFEDASSNIVGISETQLDSVPANGSVPVSVLYLANPKIDSQRTQMYAYALR